MAEQNEEKDNKKDQLSPMMQHYMEKKEEYKDCLLFYRLGDFYEMFFDDAILASKELEINRKSLWTRRKSTNVWSTISCSRYVHFKINFKRL